MKGRLSTLALAVGLMVASAARGAGEARGGARAGVGARHEHRDASAEADVEVVEEIASGEPRTGIPEPAFVADPRGEWRSRIADGRWEVNTAHRDHLSVE